GRTRFQLPQKQGLQPQDGQMPSPPPRTSVCCRGGTGRSRRAPRSCCLLDGESGRSRTVFSLLSASLRGGLDIFLLLLALSAADSRTAHIPRQVGVGCVPSRNAALRQNLGETSATPGGPARSTGRGGTPREDEMKTLSLKVNGETRRVAADPSTPLLWVL